MVVMTYFGNLFIINVDEDELDSWHMYTVISNNTPLNIPSSLRLIDVCLPFV